MRYVAMNTMPRKIPAGMVLIHNQVRSKRDDGTDRVAAEEGFRAWFDEPSDRLELCECGWSGLEHYRLRMRD